MQFYYKDLGIDDVAMINKHERYEKHLRVRLENNQLSYSNPMTLTNSICSKSENSRNHEFLKTSVKTC